MIGAFFRKQLINFFENNQNTSLPYAVKIDSGKPGKHVVILGATHGNEKVGVRFARQSILRFKRNPSLLRQGSITFILANPKAFAKSIRYIDTDLNRAFLPDSELDTSNVYEHHRVKEIREYFTKNKPDLLIDLHSVSVGNFKILITEKNDTEGKNLLKRNAVLDTLFLFREEDVPNSTMYEANTHGGVGIAIECGNHNKDSALRTARKSVQFILHDIGMGNSANWIDSFAKKIPKVYETIAIIKAGTDFTYLLSGVKTGKKVDKGTLISETKEHGVQKAPEKSILFMPTKASLVRSTDKDAGFFCIER